MYARMVERRHLAVLLGRETRKPRLAGMHDQSIGAGRPDGTRHDIERFLGVLLVDAEAALDRDRHRDRRLHGRDAVADQGGLGHQAGAEAAFLHAIGRTADVEVDLGVARVGADARACRERARIGPAELHRHRVLERIEAEEPCAVAVQHGAGRHHLGVDQRAAREQAMEVPAVPVRPFHHRRDAEAMGLMRQRSPRSTDAPSCASQAAHARVSTQYRAKVTPRCRRRWRCSRAPVRARRPRRRAPRRIRRTRGRRSAARSAWHRPRTRRTRSRPAVR